MVNGCLKNSSIKLSEVKIMIGNQNWIHTPDLFELLFYHSHQHNDDYELNIYKNILTKTDACRRNYKSDG